MKNRFFPHLKHAPAISFLLLHALAFCYPFILRVGERTFSEVSVAWPETFQDRPLMKIGLSETEREYIENFPGTMERFTDGEREVVIRQIVAPSRKVHPVSDCLKGSGYSVSPLPISVAPDGTLWGCVVAVRGVTKKKICERITDMDGQSWTDPSSWYWAAILGRTEGPWQAVVIEQINEE
jgi:hypothetical protein